MKLAFQSTRPRGARRTASASPLRYRVSIHAPTGGATPRFSYTSRNNCCINTRDNRGRDSTQNARQPLSRMRAICAGSLSRWFPRCQKRGSRQLSSRPCRTSSSRGSAAEVSGRASMRAILPQPARRRNAVAHLDSLASAPASRTVGIGWMSMENRGILERHPGPTT